jgi:hypothetical protein
MTNDGFISTFFNGLREQQKLHSAGTTQEISVIRCLRWAMKNGMNIEIKRASAMAGTLMSLRLVKDDKSWHSVDSDTEISVTDDRIEKGLWELEYETMLCAGLKSANGLDLVLQLLRKGRLSLPNHNDLRSEVIMNRHTMRISFLGKDANGEDDLYGGFLLLNDEVVMETGPQKRIRDVLDNLESSVDARRRED